MGINIIEDGIQLNDPTGFAPDLFDIDWATIDRVENLRVPSASLYGGNSSGRIINMITQDGPYIMSTTLVRKRILSYSHLIPK